MPPNYSHRLRRRSTETPNEIRRYRLQAGLTQASVARRLCVRITTISDWEGGLTCPTLKMAARLGVILQAPVQALYPGVFFPLGRVDLSLHAI